MSESPLPNQLALQTSSTEQQLVLRKALMKAMKILNISRKQFCTIIGISEASASRFYEGKRALDPYSKQGELALLLLRMFRSLDALLGGNAEHCRQWLHSENSYLCMKPIDLLTTVTGLIQVVDYLDAMRGKL